MVSGCFPALRLANVQRGVTDSISVHMNHLENLTKYEPCLVGLSWGLRVCISDMLGVTEMLPAHEPHSEEQEIRPLLSAPGHQVFIKT